VDQAVQDFLTVGLRARDQSTVATCRTLAETHIVPAREACKLRDLTADDVDD
jgi:hypothetical protein